MNTELRTINRYNEEVLNEGNLDALDELLHPDYKHLTPPPGLTPDREGIRNFFQMVSSAFPDYNLTVRDTVTSGDRVVQRWTATATHEGKFMDVPASGNKVEFDGISMYQLRDGKIFRDATIADMMSLMQQIEAVPALG